MKLKLPVLNLRHLKSLSLRNIYLAAALTLTGLGQTLRAADVTWDGGLTGAGTLWLAATNWNPDGAPGAADNAIFDSGGTATVIAVDMGTAGGSQQIGSVTMGSGRTANTFIRNLTSSTANGTLIVNGVNGILFSNISATSSLTFSNGLTGSNSKLTVGLATSGDIYCSGSGGTAGQITFGSTIADSGGSRSITKLGPGRLRFYGTNTYTGTTTVNQGDLEVDDVATIGIGTNTLFLSGGNLQINASRNGTSASALPVANPIIITTDAYIQNKSGTATTRFFALSGTLDGSAGTLKIANPTTTPGNTFAVRFFNPAINFNRPMIVGESGYDLSLAFTVMESANTNGTQIFSGDISGVGSIRRLNPYSASAAAGTTIFTGDNTYSGGTTLTSGTLLANNTSGSALGSGQVTASSINSVLGGNGTIIAPVTVLTNAAIAPGSTATNYGNLTIDNLTFGPGAVYTWNVGAASGSGTAGVNWDLITASSGWTDAANSGTPITIKVDSRGLTPTGWNGAVAQDWIIISSGTANSFDVSHFAINTTAFVGSAPGIFALNTVGGDLHLTYTPAPDIIINVASGSVVQAATSPTNYPILTGAVGVQKVGNGEVILDNSANDYQGSTKIYAGTASLAVDALNGSGGFGASSTAVLLGYTSGNSNAAININTAGVTMSRAITVQSGSSGTKTIGSSINSGTATYSGGITLQDNATLTTAAGGETLFSGNASGTGGLNLGGSGSLTLAGVASYAGTTTLTGGTLNLNNKAIGTNTFTIASASTIDNTSGASVTLNSCPQNWNANFTFTGTTNLNLGAGLVTISAPRTLNIASNTLTVGGNITGSGGLTKTGDGTLTLTSPTTYTGATTNAAGIISLNATASFGDGSGPLVLSGGSILNTSTRSGTPISNNVTMTGDTTIYGNSTATAPSSRILPFSGTWTVASGTLRVGNTGSSNNTFFVRLTAGDNYSAPIIVGDPAFDTPGAISALEFYNDNTTPVQTISSVITGNGQIWRGNLTAGAGGTTIFTGNSTFAGGVVFNSGTIGIGLDSTPTSGTLTSGPLGTGIFEIDNDPVINIFASGSARTVGNQFLLNGVTNVTFTGTNALTFTGTGNLGTVGKMLTVNSTAPVTLSGSLTNTASLTKAGTGTLILSGDNSARTNLTRVNGGTLLINNATGSGTGQGIVNVNSGGTLGGTGTIGGNVNLNNGGTLSPGASIGTLTISSNLTLDGTVLIEANTSASPSNDLIVVSGVISNATASAVIVSNLGPAFVVGQKFQIFNAPVLNGAAMTVSGGGVNWTNTLDVDGSIAVLSVISSVNTNSFALGSVISSNNLNLSWPPDRLGWKVQLQTNSLTTGLGANWVTLPATATVTNYSLPLNPANPAVFIRMVYP